MPSVELALDPSDGVMFHHNRLLWKEHHLPLTAIRTGASVISLMGELSRVMLSASGPGRLAVSHGQAGELVVLPVQPNQAIDVGEVLWAEAFGPGRVAVSTAHFSASTPGAGERYQIDKRVTSELSWD